MIEAPESRMVDAPRIAVFPCGNLDRGDDGAAIRITHDLGLADHPDVELREPGELSLEALAELPDGTRVVILDAVIGPSPGTIVSTDLDRLGWVSSATSATSTHALPMDRLVELAGLLRGHPLEGRVVGIGAAQAWPGASLSPAVSAALPAFAEAVTAAIDELSPTSR